MDKFSQQLGTQLKKGVELPSIASTDVSVLKLKDALDTRLSSMANVGSDPLSGYSMKALDAARRAQEMGIAFGVTKSQLAKQRAISNAEEKAIDNFFSQQSRANKKRLGYYSRGHTQGNDLYTKRFAGQMLGMGPDLYKVIR